MKKYHMQVLQKENLKNIMKKNVIQLPKIVCFKDIITIQILENRLNGEFLKNSHIMKHQKNLKKGYKKIIRKCFI